VAQELQTQKDPLLLVIAKAAQDPTVDIGKMQQLLDMAERVQTKSAERAFYESFAAMQGELPSIDKTGAIRDKSGKVQSTYAKWEDINEAIRPVLQKHGFALTFQTKMIGANVNIRGVLAHRGGHLIDSEIPLPADTSGNKNAVQSMGSSVSYGKRYMACALCNITAAGEDDDGGGGGDRMQEIKSFPELEEAAGKGWVELQAAWAKMSPADRNLVGGGFRDLKKRAEDADAAKKAAPK